MLTRIFATAILAQLNFRFLMHIRFVTFQFARQRETRAAYVARVRSLRCCSNGYGCRGLYDNLLRLLQIAGCRIVNLFMMIQQAHVTKYQTANVALEARTGNSRSYAHLIQ